MSLRLPAGVTDVIYYTYSWYIQNNNIQFKWFLSFSTTQFIDLSFVDDKSDMGKRNSPRNIFRTSPIYLYIGPRRRPAPRWQRSTSRDSLLLPSHRCAARDRQPHGYNNRSAAVGRRAPVNSAIAAA